MNTPQPAPGPHPPYYPPPRKRRVWPWVLLGVFAFFTLLFGGCIALIGTAANEVAESEEQSKIPAPVGTEVRDGKFAFLVTRVDPPVASVGDNEFFREEAQGEFVLVHVEVSNTGDQPQTYFGENQKLVDDQGRVYSNDTGAEFNLNKDLVTEINPGNKISAVLVFDVPKGTVATAVEFHDSAFSNGVRVALR